MRGITSEFVYTGNACLLDRLIVSFGPFMEFLEKEKKIQHHQTYPLNVAIP